MDIEALEARKLEVEVRKLTAEAEEAEIRRDRALRDDAEKRAFADTHHIYHFFEEVRGSSVASAIAKLRMWSRRDPEKDITIIFNSPGGSVIHGLALYDELMELRADGLKINTVARGMAASMGGVLLQAGEERTVGRNAHILIHEASTMALGKISELEDEIDFTKRYLQERILDILAERSTLTKQQIKRRWSRKDWWLSATEALELGFADRIG